MMFCVLFLIFILLVALTCRNTAEVITSTSNADFWEESKCRRSSIMGVDQSGRCLSSICGIKISDGIFDSADVTQLRLIAEKGMSLRKKAGGPTILDINTGYIRDTNGISNLFKERSIFTEEDFSSYGRMIEKLKRKVEDIFDIQDLHFTAPTFITRLNYEKKWLPARKC